MKRRGCAVLEGRVKMGGSIEQGYEAGCADFKSQGEMWIHGDLMSEESCAKMESQRGF